MLCSSRLRRSCSPSVRPRRSRRAPRRSRPTLLHPGAALTALVAESASRRDTELLHRSAGRIGTARGGRVHEALGSPRDVDTVRHGGAPGPLRRRGLRGQPARRPDPDLELAVVRRRGAEGLDHRPGRRRASPAGPCDKVPPLYPRKFLTNSRLGRRPAAAVGDHVQQERRSRRRRRRRTGRTCSTRSGRAGSSSPTRRAHRRSSTSGGRSRAENGGTAYLERLRAQATRLYRGVAPLTQALASGEAAIAVPAFRRSSTARVDRGAPLAMNTPGVTTGPEAIDRDHEERAQPERGAALRVLAADAGRAGGAQRRPGLDLAVGREDGAGRTTCASTRTSRSGRRTRSTGRSAFGSP